MMKKEIHEKTVNIVSTALALCAGLFVQTAATDTIKAFIPTSGAWLYEIIIAIITVVAVSIMIYLLNKTTGGK